MDSKPDDPMEEFNQEAKIEAARGMIRTQGFNPDDFRVEGTSGGVRVRHPASGMEAEYPLLDDEGDWVASLDHALRRGDYPKPD